MKTYLPRYILNVILSAMGALGAVFCVTTGFGFPVSVPVVVLCTLFAAMYINLCFMWKKALWSLIPVALIILVLALFTGVFSAVEPTLTQVVHDILTMFSSAYPNFSFAIPEMPEMPLGQSLTMLFSILGMLLAVWMAWGVGYRSCLISVAGTLPFLLLCVIINDTPPHVVPLVMLLSAWVTSLLSKERHGEPPSMDAIRVSLVLFAVLLFLSVIGTVYPKADTRDQDLPDLVQDIVDMLPQPLQDLLERDNNGKPARQLGADTSTVLDLTQQGVRDRSDDVMMQLSTTEVGPLYLRGAAKDIYTGTSWESSDMASSADSVYAQTSLGTAFGADNQAAVQIKNYNDNRSKVLFAPYGYISCTSAEDIVSDLRVNINEEDYIVYYWPGVRSLDLTTDSGLSNESYDAYVMNTCLSIPEDTKAVLYDLAISYGYDPEMSTAETVAWVASFIRDSGVYKLDVSRQPVNQDFAVHFLTESKQGYCVHFATAAAAMYRALGVPSRYASGYRVTVPASGIVVDVLDRDTHAWAEVYIEGLGWIPVETTPGFGETSALPQVEAPTPPEPTPTPEPEEPSPSPEAASEPTPSEVPAEPTPEPEEQQSPASGSDSQAAEGTSGPRSPVVYVLWVICGALILFLLVLMIRRIVVRTRRKKAFRHTNTNQRVINMWQYLERLVPWGAQIPKSMETLALKAKFSPHEITLEELSPYEVSLYQVYFDTRKHLTRRKWLRFKWLHALDLKIKKKK